MQTLGRDGVAVLGEIRVVPCEPHALVEYIILLCLVIIVVEITSPFTTEKK